MSGRSASRAVSGSDKRLTLVATILGSSIAILDGSVVSVALPVDPAKPRWIARRHHEWQA
jgi:hypothetical protein